MSKHPDRYVDADHLLLEMAAGEESTRPESYTRIGRGNENDLCYELYQAGLIVESHFQGFTTWLTDRGRARALELRRERGWAENRLFCTECGHGVLQHRGRNTTVRDVDRDLLDLEANREGTRLKDGRGIWDLHNECQVEGCDCRFCCPPWPGKTDRG